MTIDDKVLKLHIWDTAGQERFKTVTSSYYRGAKGVIIVFDVCDKDSFDHVVTWLEDVKKYAGENIICLLIGNKCDEPEVRIISKTDAEELAALYNIPYFETSAKAGTNINEAFELLARNMLADSKLTDNRSSRSPIDVDLAKKETSYSCCKFT